MDSPVHDTRPIVVGVDPSDSARTAAQWAADLATLWRAPLHLVNVVPGVNVEAPIRPLPGWLTELGVSAARAGVEPEVTEVVPGGTVEVLGARAARARLLVLGSYGDGAWSGMLAGSVALGLIDRVGCPVAVVRGAAPHVSPPRSGPIVVGVDGSEAGHAALRAAASLSSSLGARLEVVHAWADSVVGPGGGARRRSASVSEPLAEGADVLDSEVTHAREMYPGLTVERELVDDTPLRALLGRAGEARLIVVGHEGFRVASGMALGSTSRGLVELAACPVLVIRPDSVRGATGSTSSSSAGRSRP